MGDVRRAHEGKYIQLDLASAESTVIAWEQQHRTVRSLSASDVGAALDHAGDLAALLKDAERNARARLYRDPRSRAAPRPAETGSKLGWS